MSFVKHAVIAAAGLGSRFGAGLPKCLLQVNRKPLIEYQLKLLKNVEDLRIVIGFREHEVIETVLKYRTDVIFVRNPLYRITSTLASYHLGSSGIFERCLFMDADILFDPFSFAQFIEYCAEIKVDIIGYTDAKTNDAIYVGISEKKRVLSFSREHSSKFEWANVCYINPSLLQPDGESVFEQLEKYLPIQGKHIISYEIDTPSDFEIAKLSNIANHSLYL